MKHGKSNKVNDMTTTEDTRTSRLKLLDELVQKHGFEYDDFGFGTCRMRRSSDPAARALTLDIGYDAGTVLKNFYYADYTVPRKFSSVSPDEVERVGPYDLTGEQDRIVDAAEAVMIEAYEGSDEWSPE